MKCTLIRLPDGATGFVCGSKPRPKRCGVDACGMIATRLCDWKVGTGKTCDLPLCIEHAHVPAPEKDLCPTHARVWADRQKAAETCTERKPDA